MAYGAYDHGGSSDSIFDFVSNYAKRGSFYDEGLFVDRIPR